MSRDLNVTFIMDVILEKENIRTKVTSPVFLLSFVPQPGLIVEPFKCCTPEHPPKVAQVTFQIRGNIHKVKLHPIHVDDESVLKDILDEGWAVITPKNLINNT